MFSMTATKGARARCSLAVSAFLCCALFGSLPASAAAESDEDVAASIVQKADEVRFPADSFEATVAIETAGAGDAAGVRKYRVLSKGKDNTVVMVTEPASERGQIMLMKGHDLWVFMPNVSQPVRISLSQRLTGQVANGDLARANFSGDYDAKVLRTEKIENDDYYVLELTAKERSVTYHRVIYWVRKSNAWPLKAEFYSVSGRLLKSCSYEGWKRVAGRQRPTRLVMQDALRPDEKSVLDYSEMKAREIPDRVFTKDYLKRLE